MTIKIDMAMIGEAATWEMTERAAAYLCDHGFDVEAVECTDDHEVNDIPEAFWDAAVEFAASACDEETNERLNAFVRTEDPDWCDTEWRVFRSNGKGAYWYIESEEYAPGYANIIEGETGELMFLNREDAIDQWGEDVEWLREYGWDEDEECGLSLNNGNTYTYGAYLDAELERFGNIEEEAQKVINDIEIAGRFWESGTPSEVCYNAISQECGAWDSQIETMHAILHRLWEGGIDEYTLP